MELLQFEITNAGTLGGRWTPPALETKKPSCLNIERFNGKYLSVPNPTLFL